MNFSSTKRNVFNLKADRRKFCYKLETCILEKIKRGRERFIHRYHLRAEWSRTVSCDVSGEQLPS